MLYGRIHIDLHRNGIYAILLGNNNNEKNGGRGLLALPQSPVCTYHQSRTSVRLSPNLWYFSFILDRA